MGFEISNLEVEAGDHLAFCYSINRVIAIRNNGEKIDMCWRSTFCFRLIDGKWMVTHSHSSVPFDIRSGMASVDLKA